MIDKDIVKRYIVDFHSRDFSDVRGREIEIKPIRSKATCIVGPRRVGKTYLLFSLMDNPVKYLYIDFEDPIFYGSEPRDIIDILDAYSELYPEIERPTVFLDEVQVIRDWERIVRHLLNMGFDTYVTGSSSKLLSHEIATHLRGRAITYTLFPLSFIEYLTFKNIGFKGRELYQNYSLIRSSIEEYLRYGGYPEVVLHEEKDRILREYLNVMIRRDVIERYGLRNRYLVNELMYFALNNYAKYMTYDSLYNLFKQRIKVTKKTLINYISYFEDSQLLLLLRRYQPSIKARISSPRKIYLIDVGLATIFEKDIARDMENTVYIELLRRNHYYNPQMEIYYYRNNQGYEVDFIIKEGKQIKECIQVTYANSHDEIERREIRALIKAREGLKCKNLKIITYDYEDEVVESWYGSKERIIYIPLWKWMLKPKNESQGSL